MESFEQGEGGGGGGDGGGDVFRFSFGNATLATMWRQDWQQKSRAVDTEARFSWDEQ